MSHSCIYIVLCALVVPTTVFADELELKLFAFSEAHLALDWRQPGKQTQQRRYRYRGFDLTEGFSIPLAGLDVVYGTEEVGLALDLRAGLGAKRLLGLGEEEEDLAFVGVRQAYVQWRKPSFSLEVGLMGHIFGAESPDKSWLNRHHTRSVARMLYQPQQHLGVRGSWLVAEEWGVTVLVDSGTQLDMTASIDGVPSLGLQLYVMLSQIDLYLGYYGGSLGERASFTDFGHAFEFMLDASLGRVGLELSLDYGITAPGAPVTAEYFAVMGGISAELATDWTASGRLEYVISPAEDGTNLEIFARLLVGTVTLGYQPSDALLLRIETRVESARNRIFSINEGRFESTWVTSTLSAVAFFGESTSADR